MKFFNNNENDNDVKFPGIEEISVRMPAVSEYCGVTRLPELFEQADSYTLPVIDLQGRIIGVVSDYDLVGILPEWSFKKESYQCNIKVADIMKKEVLTETTGGDFKELIDKINDAHTRIIPIVDKEKFYTGNTITRASVISYLTKLIKPSSLGGLATPLGVYITDGKHQAGAGNFGLFLTGISLGTVLLTIEFVFKTVNKFFHINMLNSAIFPVIFVLQIFIFLLILRLTPLAKIHAAEHQTINAIEKGLPLTLNAVKMQPREHIRCGTNIMALFIGLQLVILTFVGYLKKIDPIFQFVFLFAGFMFVFSNWKKWGMWLQTNFTTVKAADSYILNGIKVGEEILQKHKEDLDAKPASLGRKIWCMSLIQIIAGFLFIQWFFEFLYKIFIK